MDISIFYTSDLHLERYKLNKFPKFEQKGDLLLLAGDICEAFHPNLELFLKYVSNNFTKIIYVPGNHEYYQSKKKMKSYFEVNSQLKQLEDTIENLTILIQGELIFKSIRFLGTTLWTNIPEENEGFIHAQMNDYNMIYHGYEKLVDGRKQGHLFTPSSTKKLHYQHFEWLKSKLEDKTYPTIVITHHSPSFSILNPKYKNVQNAYATDLEYLFKEPLKAWVCGHVHDKIKKEINNIPLLLNPMGYINEKTGFDKLEQL